MSTKQNSDKKDYAQGKKQDALETKLKRCQKEISQLKQELQEKNDKLLRSYADLQNYQKRMEKELQLKEEETKIKYLSELVDVNELLQKAYQDKDPKEGIKAILNNLNNFFEKEQVIHIDCVGKTFDHNCHHAISTVLKDDDNEDIIVEEVKKGYMVGEKVLRPSQVIVGKNKNIENKEGK
jgi:molecular chaperone GrpE